MTMHHKNRRDENLTNNKNKKKQITIYLPPELKKKLQLEAANRGYTLKDLLVIILNEYLEKANSQE